jgi:surfeit locus 1 family protein
MATDTANPTPETDADPASQGDTGSAKARLNGRALIPPTVQAFIASRHFGVWSSVIAVTMCITLFGLGTWQVMRLHQKNALIAHITAQLAQPERDLRLRPPEDDAAWQALDYRRVVLQGDWLDLHQMKIIPRTYEGQNGYHLIVPLHLPNGQIVLVNRGWVADKTELGPTSYTGGTIAAGIVRLAPTEKPFGMLDNNPTRQQWAWPDIKAMANAIGVHDIAPVILYAERSVDKPDDYPIGGQAQLQIRNEHKQYALIWYTLAFALLIIWLMASTRKVQAATVATAEASADAD